MDHLIFHEHFDAGPGRSPAWSESSVEVSRPASHGPYTNRHVFLNIYNPANQTKKELIDNFVVRIKEFNEILEAVKHNEWLNPPRHFIVQGQRGSGKTTLLLRLYYELKELQPQNNWLITVRFDEEQYNIRTLYKLWENIAIYLEDELLEGFSGVYDEMQLHIEDRDYERICFDILKRNLQKTGKKLILLIDNFGDMLGKFDRREHQRLESILLKENCLRIIGGSSVIVDYKHDYTLPLYELFRIIQLEGLSQDETTELLLNLGKNYETNSINEIIRDDPGRVEALRRLTSGVPRTIVLLYEIFIDNESGDSFRDLETILDRVTPLYKHRMDDLSPQQQEIVHAIAMNWDAVGVREIARITRMESKAVSAQLKQLEYNRIVSKIRTNIKNHFYQINERFFNIWYLMRYGRRRDRNKVLWLVRFLQNWCSREELIQRAERHIRAMQKGAMYEKHALYMTQALSHTEIPEDLQYMMIKETRRLLSEKNKELLEELSKSDKELYNAFALHYTEKDYSQALKNLLEIRNKTGFVLAMTGFLYELHLKEFQRAEDYYLQAIKKGYDGMISNLAGLYETEFEEYKKAEKYYQMAFRKGNTEAMLGLARMHHLKLKNIKKAIHFYKLAIDENSTEAMNNLALLYQSEQKDYQQAEKYFRMAIDAGSFEAMNNLAWLYFITKTNRKEALQLLQTAGPENTNVTNTYVCAMVLIWNNKFREGIQYARDFMENSEMITRFHMGIEPYLMLLIAKKQYDYIYTLFAENRYNIRDVYKPIYYALMRLMKDIYPDEHKRMGEEISLTVDEVLGQIRQMAVDYAI